MIRRWDYDSIYIPNSLILLEDISINSIIARLDLILS